MRSKPVSVRVSGDFALFTRPEAKVERMTYPVMTPSAARGILEAIYWHPQFRWAIEEIHVLRPYQTYSLLRNEVNSKMPLRDTGPYFADEDRSQRHSVCLREVDYIIVAEPVVHPGEAEPAQKHREIFERRVAKGQCYHRPALGCREFAADFGPVGGEEQPVDWTQDLGLMLWDVDYSRKKPPFPPLFFHAELKNGVMRVPRQPLGVGE